MRPCASVVVAYLASCAVAASIGPGISLRSYDAALRSDGTRGRLVSVRGATHASENLKYAAASPSSGQVQETIHGSVSKVDQFIDGLKLSDLKSIFGADYGKPFRITFVDDSGKYLGYLAGYFTSDGGVQLDPDSSIPGGTKVPSSVGGSGSGDVIQETIHGSVSEVSQFIDQLSLSSLRSILGNGYGSPFKITFVDNSGTYLGYLAGYFTSDGTVEFDPASRIPNGGRVPAAIISTNTAPKTVTVTLSGARSGQIEKAGSLSDQDLHDILGGNYGKPFKIIFTNSSGKNSGSVSGTFNGNGVVFDSDSKIPGEEKAPTVTGPPVSVPTVKVTLSGTTRADIIKQLQGFSQDQIKQLFGSNYGKPFTITFTTSGGKKETLSGFFNSSGAITISPADNSDDTASATTKPSMAAKPPTPTMPPASSETNTAKVTFSGSQADITKALNNISYDYLHKALGDNYGPFYITFKSDDGNLSGYIKGTFTKTSYNYEWSFTYTTSTSSSSS